MAFRKINEGEIESDDGFKVSIGLSRVTYLEGGNSIPLDAEHMADGTLVIYGFQPGAPLDASERRRVVTNIRAALLSLGVKFEIESA
jgi:hypothetical protein